MPSHKKSATSKNRNHRSVAFGQNQAQPEAPPPIPTSPPFFTELTFTSPPVPVHVPGPAPEPEPGEDTAAADVGIIINSTSNSNTGGHVHHHHHSYSHNTNLPSAAAPVVSYHSNFLGLFAGDEGNTPLPVAGNVPTRLTDLVPPMEVDVDHFEGEGDGGRGLGFDVEGQGQAQSLFGLALGLGLGPSDIPFHSSNSNPHGTRQIEDFDYVGGWGYDEHGRQQYVPRGNIEQAIEEEQEGEEEEAREEEGGTDGPGVPALAVYASRLTDAISLPASATPPPRPFFNSRQELLPQSPLVSEPTAGPVIAGSSRIQNRRLSAITNQSRTLAAAPFVSSPLSASSFLPLRGFSGLGEPSAALSSSYEPPGDSVPSLRGFHNVHQYPQPQRPQAQQQQAKYVVPEEVGLELGIGRRKLSRSPPASRSPFPHAPPSQQQPDDNLLVPATSSPPTPPTAHSSSTPTTTHVSTNPPTPPPPLSALADSLSSLPPLRGFQNLGPSSVSAFASAAPSAPIPASSSSSSMFAKQQNLHRVRVGPREREYREWAYRAYSDHDRITEEGSRDMIMFASGSEANSATGGWAKDKSRSRRMSGSTGGVGVGVDGSSAVAEAEAISTSLVDIWDVEMGGLDGDGDGDVDMGLGMDTRRTSTPVLKRVSPAPQAVSAHTRSNAPSPATVLAAASSAGPVPQFNHPAPPSFIPPSGLPSSIPLFEGKVPRPGTADEERKHRHRHEKKKQHQPMKRHHPRPHHPSTGTETRNQPPIFPHSSSPRASAPVHTQTQTQIPIPVPIPIPIQVREPGYHGHDRYNYHPPSSLSLPGSPEPIIIILPREQGVRVRRQGHDQYSEYPDYQDEVPHRRSRRYNYNFASTGTGNHHHHHHHQHHDHSTSTTAGSSSINEREMIEQNVSSIEEISELVRGIQRFVGELRAWNEVEVNEEEGEVEEEEVLEQHRPRIRPQLRHVQPLLDTCKDILESLVRIRGTLVRRWTLPDEHWNHLSVESREKYEGRLMSLQRCLRRLTDMANRIIEPSKLDILLQKLGQHYEKLTNVADKLDDTFERLKLRHLYTIASQLTEEANKNRSTYMSAREMYLLKKNNKSRRGGSRSRRPRPVVVSHY